MIGQILHVIAQLTVTAESITQVKYLLSSKLLTSMQQWFDQNCLSPNLTKFQIILCQSRYTNFHIKIMIQGHDMYNV